MIVLTAEEADKVRGFSPAKEGHALAPVPLKDGRFMLGEEVLDDETHADVQAFLDLMPREPIEKLPVYTEADAQPETLEVSRFSKRALSPVKIDEVGGVAPAQKEDGTGLDAGLKASV